jgi:TPR repeat protein
MAERLAQGQLGAQDPRTAAAMLGPAYTRGYRDACSSLAHLLDRLDGPDSITAARAYRRACTLGSALACERLRAPSR